MPRQTYVRVRDKETGHHVSISEARYTANPEPWQLLKQPGANPDGTPRAPKYKTTVAEKATASTTTATRKAADSKAATPATSDEENS